MRNLGSDAAILARDLERARGERRVIVGVNDVVVRAG